MTLTILDQFKEGDATGYFCKVNALDFIQELPSNFEDYFVQRGIVRNRYLDSLWETLVEHRHIPIIVVIGDEVYDQVNPPQLLGNWKILDGLQRTNRLKTILETAKFIDSHVSRQPMLFDEMPLNARELARVHRGTLKEIGCPAVLFAKMLKTKHEDRDRPLTDIVQQNSLWLEFWVGLTEDEQIKKMLLLNAGHKSVSIKHQIELLFASYLPIFEHEFPKGIIRERDRSAMAYSKNRKQGEFFFAHLVTAFESLKMGKPVSTNAEFAADLANTNLENTDDLGDVSKGDLYDFCAFLNDLDHEFSEPIEIKWLGREVVLAGLFAAIGAHSQEHHIVPSRTFSKLSYDMKGFKKWLDLHEFERVRNSQDTGRVNIGTMNKTAVMLAVKSYLQEGNNHTIDWNAFFNPRSVETFIFRGDHL